MSQRSGHVPEFISAEFQLRNHLADFCNSCGRILNEGQQTHGMDKKADLLFIPKMRAYMSQESIEDLECLVGRQHDALEQQRIQRLHDGPTVPIVLDGQYFEDEFGRTAAVDYSQGFCQLLQPEFIRPRLSGLLAFLQHAFDSLPNRRRIAFAPFFIEAPRQLALACIPNLFVVGAPGVRAAGLANFVPGTVEEPPTDNVAPMSALYVSKGPLCDTVAATPLFFDAVGMKILQGRDFNWSDGPHQPKAVILSASLAKRLFPDGGAIGAHVRIGTVPDTQNLEVVGVVSDARLFGRREARPLTVFENSVQFWPDELNGELFVRAAQNPLRLASAVSGIVASLGDQFAARSMTLEEAQSQSLIEERLSAMISSFLGGFALLLACMGLYGLISHNVTRRTREIGIRMALGAQRRNIMRLVLSQAVVLSLTGIVLGVLCSLAASRLLSTMLYGVSPNDVLSVTGASLALLFIGLIAGYLPARRAMRVDPMVALRYE